MNAADLFTFGSLSLGVVALFALIEGFPVVAAVLLLAAVIADFLDGKIARKLNEESAFGKYLDSVADMAVFGLLPVVVAFLLVDRTWYVVVAGIWFVCCGGYRLARFMARKKKDFEGMPITVNGAGTAALILFATQAWMFAAYFVVAGALMVSKLKVRKV